MFCDANFEGGICCNPGSNPAALRIQGITTPGEQNFVFYDPAAQALKLPALRAEVTEPGRLRPRLFLPAFFSSSAELSKSAQTCLKSPWWGRDFPCPEEGHTAPYRGAHGALSVFCAKSAVPAANSSVPPSETSAAGSNDPLPPGSAGWCTDCCRSTSYYACQYRLCF